MAEAPIVGKMLGAGPKGEVVVVSDMTQWPTRAELADELGVSVTMITKYVRKGWIVEHRDSENTSRYCPNEVDGLKEKVAEMRSKKFAVPAGDEDVEVPELYAKHGHTDISRVLAMVTVPRERADAALFQIIDRLEAECRELKEENKTLRGLDLERLREERRAKAEEQEQKTAAAIVERQEAIKAEAMMRILQKIDRVLGGGVHFLDKISDEKLRQLSELPPDYWDEGERTALREAAERRKQKSNGATNGAAANPPQPKKEHATS